MSTPTQTFSDQLEHWLDGKQPKTLDGLIAVFGERSFAVIILLFMFLPALPLPTAAHPLEVAAAIIEVQMIIGLKTIWLPKFLTTRIKLGSILRGRVRKVLLGRLRWFEDRSRERWTWVFGLPLFERLTGLLLLAFSAGAFFAPPLSALDTLPALGAVVVCLALIVEDSVLYVVGVAVGVAGIAAEIFLGEIIVRFFKHLLHHK